MRELRRLFVTWLAVYLLVTSLMFVAGPLLSGLPLMLRTLVLTLILVPVLRYGLPRLISWTGRGFPAGIG